ncbi:MAG: hypothetical protein ACHQ53_19230, partial [Polyangiales bacterium]
MGARQMAFEFGPVRPAPWLDPLAEDARKQQVLCRTLSGLLGREIALTFTDNSRTMLSAREQQGIAHVRLHHMFVDADETTVRALARYLEDRHATASAQIQRFIRTHGYRIRSRPHLPPGPETDVEHAHSREAPRALGRHHDLSAMLGALNHRYFERPVDARIGWARMARGQGRGRRRCSIKLGSYRARNPLIHVHPVLDADWVPAFFVEYIVYHEMLHHV